MDPASQQTCLPASQADWAAFVSKHGLPPRPEYRRRHPRRAFVAAAQIAYHPPAEGPRLDDCLLAEVANEAITLRSRVRIPPQTMLAVRIKSGQRWLLLYGEVIHCTQSVGAYKIGVHLTFPDAPRVAPRPPTGPRTSN